MVKNTPASAGDVGSISVLGRSPGDETGSLPQYSCWGNPMDKEAKWATVRGVARTVRHDLETKQQQQVAYKARRQGYL